MKLITTSWDDGDILDFKIADYLDKYNLKGTFYIPRKIPGKMVMGEDDIFKLSQKYEVGGHTLNHTNLKEASAKKVEYEVSGCYKWITEVTGNLPVSFCPPKGYFTNEVLKEIYAAGFKLIRTTNLLSPFVGKSITNTTLQVYEHSNFTLFKNILKRGRINSLNVWLQGGASNNLLKMVDHYLNYILKNDGCLHIWGHSWEIEDKGLWPKLDLMLKAVSGVNEVQYIENKQLIVNNI